jgi:glutamate 5-kinase
LRRHGTHAAQLLLTAEDIDNRTRYLNVRNTILTLFEYGAVPIVNENDSVSVEEICFGDNDRLAAMITNLLAAPLLVMLSVVEGLYEGHPGSEGGAAQPIPLVRDLNHSTFALAAPTLSRRGIGGMPSKLEAARMATAAGASVIIASGRRPRVLEEIFRGEQVGTLVLAQGAAVTAWKRWIGFSVRPRGHYVVDEGARTAVEHSGRSLLPAGVVDVVGQFHKGDVVALRDGGGVEFGRGLSNYAAEEARKIKGLRTQQIHEALGTHPYDEVIHRDNLVITV